MKVDRTPAQRDLFGGQPSRMTAAARRSVPKQPMHVEPFEFNPGPECVPKSEAELPDWPGWERLANG